MKQSKYKIIRSKKLPEHCLDSLYKGNLATCKHDVKPIVENDEMLQTLHLSHRHASVSP